MKALFAATFGDQMYWSSQDGIESVIPSPPKLGKRLAMSHVTTYPLPVSPTRLAILEINDADLAAVTFVDIEPKLDKVAVLGAKHAVQAWCLVGDRLHAVLRSGKKLTGKQEQLQTLVTYDIANASELAANPLPCNAVYMKQEETGVVWLGVVGSIAAVLQGDGTLHRFTMA